MYPELIKIGPVTVHTYGFLIAVGFLVALWLAVRQAKRTGVPEEKIIDLAFYCLVAAVAGSRLFFILTNFSYYQGHLLDIFKIWEGGLVFYGGLLCAVPVGLWIVRRYALPIWKTFDIFAPSIAIGHAIGRLGCFCAGCCHGRPAEGLPWAVIFSDPHTLAIRGVPLHPTQLYESAAEFLNFLFLVTLRKRQSFDGQLFFVYIMNYAVIRAAVELFRGDDVRGFIARGVSISQGISMLMFAVAAIMYLKRRKESRAAQ
ncbi:MAG: prolipoprotein diacylglyceryl transferase [Nitrospirae bacterium]|nr:MAG: prolipoprotein diacylglyceryl transferase [Nitrospirota bacterium]